MTSSTPLFHGSRFSWVKDLEPGRNQFVSFERRFSLARPASAQLHVFADTRYRLWVNEIFVAYGPARFVTTHPEYDSHDLTSLLRAGENLVRVEVNYYGASSFQTMRNGLPGFIAAGGLEDGSESFATPGSWSGRVHQAWDSHAPLFSFAQNPAEICDTRMLAEELGSSATRPVVAKAAAATPWAEPVPRSASYPDYARVSPVRMSVSGPATNRLQWGMQIKDGVHGVSTAPRLEGPHVMFSTWIHSPRQQDVLLECFWANLELNGQALTIVYPPHLGNHGEAKISLRAGWNFLAGNFAVLLEYWAFLLGLPFASEASLHARPDLACEEIFALSPYAQTVTIPSCPSTPEKFAVPSGWKLIANQIFQVTPARLTGWDSPLRPASSYEVPKERFGEASTHTARTAIWTFDFADEYYGQPVIEVEAPAGSVLDVAYDDWKREDGCVALYQSNPMVDAVDRFILRGGRQRIEVLNPRGGIYLEVVLRAPAGSDPVPLSVHDLAIRRRTTISTIEGSFSCGDPVLDWAWECSVHTLQASTDEGYADCPWRERGSYIGDSLVNVHLNRLATADLSMAKRTVTLMGQAQLPDGQLPPCAPAWLSRSHEDFTLLWIQAVRDIWAYNGDADFVAAQWPVIQRIWKSSAWKCDGDDLWDSTGQHVFVDWGVLHSERGGAGNGVINILRVAAARASAELASVLDRPKECAQHAAEAERIGSLLIDKLWNKKEGRFDASIGASTPAIHANILALRYGLGPAEEILAYLEPMLRGNFARGRKEGASGGYVELYFFYYLFPALAAQGRYQLVEEMIREHYGFLQSLGYPTLTECFTAADRQQGSCCHSWSGAAALYASAFILGLRQVQDGRPDAYILDPAPSDHAKAEGSLPHPRGTIHVRWERVGERIRAIARVPKGVVLGGGAHVDLSFENVGLRTNAAG